jgi:hypothetical protein
MLIPFFFFFFFFFFSLSFQVSIAAISLSFVEYNSGSLGYHSKLAYRRSAWPLDFKNTTNKQFVSN